MQLKDLQPKKALRTALLVLLFGAVGMGKMYADFNNVIIGDLRYDLNDNTLTATVRGHVYSSATGSLTIPETVTYEGTEYSVTTIGDSAFRNYFGLTGSLTIPNSVTSIGANAFYCCFGFTSLTIGNSVTSIGNYAFYHCSGLTGSLTIPNSVTTIGNWVFKECTHLTSLVIGNSVVSIGDDAFCLCSGLTGSLTIPNAVTTIGKRVFEECTHLTSLVIGNSVASIGDDAFYLCSGLTAITVTSGNTVYDSRENCNAIIKTSNNELVIGCKNTIIPNSVTKIGNSAFKGCSGLTGSLIIPNSVITIGWGAFSGCSGLTGSLIIPNSVITIGWGAFSGCSGLTGSLTIPNSVTSIGDFAFSGCSGLTGSLTIPNSVARINKGVFKGCSGLTGSLTISNSVTYIDQEAFKGCSGLTGSLTIPNFVTSIGQDAFRGCSGLMSLIIGNSVTYIGQEAFGGCSGLTSLVIGNSVTYIGQEAFRDCSGLTSLVIGNSVTTIGNGAFYGCSGLTGSLTIPNSVTKIGDSAFSGCSGITGTLIIPDFVTKIGLYAFKNCSGLTGLVIGKSVTSIYSVYGSFYLCNGLTTITVTPGNTVFDSRDNCNAIIRTETNSLWIGCKNTIIPNSVTEINNEAFKDCTGLVSLTIPNSVTSIGERAFSGCSGLTGSLTIPNSVISIGNYAFYDCSGLTSLTIGNSVTSIGNYAFCRCSGFTGNLTISNSVTSIGTNAFLNCSGFSGNLTIGNSVTTIGEGAFFGCSGFTGSLIIPNSVTTIGSTAFTGCSGLTGRLTIPNSVTTIGGYAFYSCSGLTSLNIGSSVTTIGDQAFDDCSGLTEIHVCRTAPASITDYVFYGTSCPIYVPYESLNTYRTASGWSSYANRIFRMVFRTIPCRGILSPMPYKAKQDMEDDTITWVFISSPLAGNTAPTAVGNIITATDYDLYQFNQSVTDGEWRNYKANTFNLVNGQGYLYANTEEVNVIFKGNFNENGTKEVSIAYDANAECAGWNLVGNPFPVNAYLLDENNEIMPFYKMNDTGDAIVAAQPGTAIKPCEGVFVICPNDGEAHSVIFTTTAPASLGEAQNGPLVSLPIHDLLVNQDAFLIIPQTITLSEGWNWFSTNIEITLDDLQTALMAAYPNAAANSLIIKSNGNGQIAWNPAAQRWIGGLNSLDLTQMYMIKVANAGEITLQGIPINPAIQPITIANGNNWIAFPLGTSMTVTDAFAGFPSNGDIVKSNTGGQATWNSTAGRWIGGLTTLEPGKGYIYKSNAIGDKTLIFPASTR